MVDEGRTHQTIPQRGALSVRFFGFKNTEL